MSYRYPNCYQRCLHSFQEITDLENDSKKLTTNDFDEVLDRITRIFKYFPLLRDHCTDTNHRTGIRINPLGLIFDELSESRDDLERLKDLIVKIKRQFPAYLESLNSQLVLPNETGYSESVFKEIVGMRELAVIDRRRSALLVLGRTVEEVLHRIGLRRKLHRNGVSIMINGRPKIWNKLTFKEMNEALCRTPITNQASAPCILSRRTKEEIDPLIVYRNFSAHGRKRIKQIEENAISYLNIGVNVLKELCNIYEEISEHSRIYRRRIVVTF